MEVEAGVVEVHYPLAAGEADAVAGGQGWGDDFESLAGPRGITAEDIFAYTYAVLHDPAYRQE